MNLQFLLTVLLGFGLGGIFQSTSGGTSLALANRLRPISPDIRMPSPKFLLFTLGKFKELVPGRGKKINASLFELPEIIDLLVVGLEAGDGIYKSLSSIVPRCAGPVGEELAEILKAVEYGGSLPIELRKVSIDQAQVKEFANKLAAALERGTPLAQVLAEQSKSARAEIRNLLLKQAGKNETRMLIPLVFLILPVTVLFAIYPSLKLLNFGFI